MYICIYEQHTVDIRKNKTKPRAQGMPYFHVFDNDIYIYTRVCVHMFVCLYWRTGGIICVSYQKLNVFDTNFYKNQRRVAIFAFYCVLHMSLIMIY